MNIRTETHLATRELDLLWLEVNIYYFLIFDFDAHGPFYVLLRALHAFA